MGVEKEILIYQNLPPSRYRWVIYISYAQVAFLSANFWAMPSRRLIQQRDKTALERLKKKAEEDGQLLLDCSDESARGGVIAEEKIEFSDLLKDIEFRKIFSLKNLVENLEEKPLEAAALGLASLAVVASLSLYTSRLVHKIILLPSDRARFYFFPPLPFRPPPSVELPLRNISCVAPRDTQHTYSILKFKDRIGYHLVNKKEGQFLAPELYDTHLGFQRSWYKK